MNNTDAAAIFNHKIIFILRYRYRSAFDGEEACRLFAEDSFSLVLLDLMIPKRSGMEVDRPADVRLDPRQHLHHGKGLRNITPLCGTTLIWGMRTR